MRRAPLHLSLLLCLMLTAALGGCGGSDDDQPADAKQPPAPTKSEFVKKAEAICVKSDDKINEDFEKFSRKHFKGGKVPSSYRQAVAGQEIVIPVIVAQVKKLKALGAPRGDERKVERIIAAYEEGIERGEDDPRLMLGTGGEYAFTKAYELAGDYGLYSCVTGG